VEVGADGRLRTTTGTRRLRDHVDGVDLAVSGTTAIRSVAFSAFLTVPRAPRVAFPFAAAMAFVSVVFGETFCSESPNLKIGAPLTPNRACTMPRTALRSVLAGASVARSACTAARHS
jgi:hypothetical protein